MEALPGYSFPIVVGLIWGATNPLLKRGTKKLESNRSKQKSLETTGGLLDDLWTLITTVEFVLPFIGNQCGSVLFYYCLSSSNYQLSMIVPLVNSITFLSTACVGRFLMGEGGDLRTLLIGSSLVTVGLAVCLLADDHQ